MRVTRRSAMRASLVGGRAFVLALVARHLTHRSCPQRSDVPPRRLATRRKADAAGRCGPLAPPAVRRP
jgi:hypothetical protein